MAPCSSSSSSRMVVAVLVALVLLQAQVRAAVQHRGEEFNLEAEIDYWRANGYPEELFFPDDEGKPARAQVANGGAPHPHPDTRMGVSLRLFGDYEKDVKFHLFTSKNETDKQGTRVSIGDSRDVLLAAGWVPERETKIIIHGFANSVSSPVIQKLKNAYLQTGEFNVIGVDWGKLCVAPMYALARSHVVGTSERVALLVDHLVEVGLADPARVHVVGHSLGAHVAGNAGSRISSGKLTRITGLDPAFPLFILTAPSGRLDETDADVVDVIHTCAGFLGFKAPLGSVDFYPNGGKKQPGCGLDPVGTCAHTRSYLLFAESIEKGKAFLGKLCEDDDVSNSCTDSVKGFMGELLKFWKKGSYFVKTSSKSPFNLNN